MLPTRRRVPGLLAAVSIALTITALAVIPGIRPVRAQGITIVALEAPGVTAVGTNAINATGQVTGSARFNGSSAAFLWTPTAPNGVTGSFRNLGTPRGYSGSGGLGLSILGDVSGSATGTGKFEHAVFWPRGGSTQIVGPTGNYVQTRSNAVNTACWVVGWYPAKARSFRRW